MQLQEEFAKSSINEERCKFIEIFVAHIQLMVQSRDMPKNVKDQEYNGKLIQVRNIQHSGWTGYVDGKVVVTGQRCQTNVLKSCIWLIENGKI
jgi:hypothetical protein